MSTAITPHLALPPTPADMAMLLMLQFVERGLREGKDIDGACRAVTLLAGGYEN